MATDINNMVQNDNSPPTMLTVRMIMQGKVRKILFLSPQYAWNIAKVIIKQQSINQYFFR